jgi:hypothetical protein
MSQIGQIVPHLQIKRSLSLLIWFPLAQLFNLYCAVLGVDVAPQVCVLDAGDDVLKLADLFMEPDDLVVPHAYNLIFAAHPFTPSVHPSQSPASAPPSPIRLCGWVSPTSQVLQQSRAMLLQVA